jgi:hypothetical protein
LDTPSRFGGRQPVRRRAEGGGERVGALACLDLGKLGHDLETLGFGEAGDGGALGVQAEP